MVIQNKKPAASKGPARLVAGLVGLSTLFSLGAAACKQPTDNEVTKGVKKEFTYTIDGVKITIENKTNKDITSCASKINDAMLSMVGRNAFDNIIQHIKDTNCDARIVIENETGGYNGFNYREDNETVVYPYEWVITADVEELKPAIMFGLAAIWVNAENAANANKLIAQGKQFSEAKQIVRAGVSVTSLA